MEKDNNLIVNMDDSSDKNNLSQVESHHSHHHSGHHSHHHSSSGKHRKRRKQKEKTKKFLKRNKYKICNAVMIVLFIFVLICLGVSLDKNISSDKKQPSNSDSLGSIETSKSLVVEIPMFEDEVVVINSAVEEYMNSEITVLASNVYRHNLHIPNLDKGLPVNLWYDIKGIPVGQRVKGAELLVSESSDFSYPVVYNLAEDETSVDVYNLKTGVKYYFRFILSVSNGTKTSIDGSFTTAEGPRMMNVEGVKNMRDFGGGRTVDGRKIRQGILFRSTELDGAVVEDYAITPDGVNAMLTVLGIKTDFDLRYAADNPNNINPLGAGVEHNYYSMPMYSEVFKQSNKETVRKVFSDLSKSGKYPVVLHCTHGMDRTGTVCYLLGAVLGVGEEDLMRDYQLSAFTHGEMWGMAQMNEFIGMLKSYEGSTLKEKAENYLLSVGVTQAEISNLRAIYLEG